MEEATLRDVGTGTLWKVQRADPWLAEVGLMTKRKPREWGGGAALYLDYGYGYTTLDICQKPELYVKNSDCGLAWWSRG